VKAFIFTYIAGASRGANHEQILLLLDATKQTILTRKPPWTDSESREDRNRNKSKEQKLPKVTWVFAFLKGLQLDLTISTRLVPRKLERCILLRILLPSFTTPED